MPFWVGFSAKAAGPGGTGEPGDGGPALRIYNAAKTPLANARRIWAASDHAFAVGESADPFFALAFRDRLETALDSEFESLAVQVFGTPAQMVQEARG